MAVQHSFSTDAFTAGVKPGGLTNSTQIRLLLCYLIRCAGPLRREEIETALLGEELVNYFEIGTALDDIVQKGLAETIDSVYTITEKGAKVASELANDLPRSVREAAVAAAVRAQAWNKKSADYHTELEKAADGSFAVRCTIRGLSTDDFSLTLRMPDKMTAECIQKGFVEHGSEIYAMLLTKLTEIQPGK